MHACFGLYGSESVRVLVPPMVNGHVRSRRRVLLRWSVNLKNKLHLYVCMYMYSPVNSVESVIQQQCGHVMLYLPSKTAVLSDLWIVLYIFTSFFFFIVFTQLETWRTAVLVNNSWCALCACKCLLVLNAFLLFLTRTPRRPSSLPPTAS